MTHCLEFKVISSVHKELNTTHSPRDTNPAVYFVHQFTVLILGPLDPRSNLTLPCTQLVLLVIKKPNYPNNKVERKGNLWTFHDSLPMLLETHVSVNSNLNCLKMQSILTVACE